MTFTSRLRTRADRYRRGRGCLHHGYPSIYRGCHWGACTAGSSFPVQLARLRPGTVTTSWSTSQPGGSSAYDVAYDIWFNQNRHHESDSRTGRNS